MKDLVLRYYGDPILRRKAEEIAKITDEIKLLVKKMIEVMDEKNGVGLAATQLGVLYKVLVIRPEIETENGFALGDIEVYINPIISNPSKEREVMSEGCLSVPGIHKEVIRPISIHIEAIDLNGNKISEDVIGFKARELMHENDHLNGKLFIDRISKEDKKDIEEDLKAIKKTYS